ncbi:hypothetical protein AVEN_70428-1 [Araneus ventricosus]|uniref:HTH CENPB-type domain-containing protein n=1 Tax=Araneus ventricosus TaxID=182803 RepID=A0A4Y2NXR5_ARAVE|nr:hypothetical protein AVEN_70428-1 [Araneus ventricosus]
MVRKYKPKKDTKLLEVKINEAVLRIENESFIARAAAIAVEIPFSTLHSHLLKLQNPSVVKHVGTVSCISVEHENDLAACLKSVARRGFPLTRKEIKITVSDFVIKNKEGTNELPVYLQKYCCFKDNMPGENWMSSFMHRHNLSAKKPKNSRKIPNMTKLK